jgi:hypothetical protein
MSRVTLYITERKRVGGVRGKGRTGLETNFCGWRAWFSGPGEGDAQDTELAAHGVSKMRDGPFVPQGKQARPLQVGTPCKDGHCLTVPDSADSINLHSGMRFLTRKFARVTAFHETCLF